MANQRFALVELIAFTIAGAAALVGFLIDDLLALTLSGAFMGIGFVIHDVRRWNRQGISPITLYAFIGTLTSVANTIAVLNQDTADRPRYFLYAIDEHLPVALKIEWLGLVLPVLAFQLAMRSPTVHALLGTLPRVWGTLNRSHLIPVCVLAAVFGTIVRVTDILPSLGTLNSIIYFLPHLAAFTLARSGLLHKQPKAVWIGLAIAAAEAGRALFFAYLRADVVMPLIAYAIGVLLGARSLRGLRSAYMLPLYPAAAIFITYFAAFGEVRSQSSGGLQRLEAVASVHEERQAGEGRPYAGLVARLSTINQLTQVVRVAREDGFLNGKSLEYLGYAWIPRFLWPEKPTIAQGAWFALRIGQARMYRGRITNSVNMTVRGELYLNFGWEGLVFGSLAFGLFFAALWNACGRMRSGENILGAAFGMYLLRIGLGGGGADLQVVVTMAAFYLLFVGIGFALFMQGRHGRFRHSTA